MKPEIYGTVARRLVNTFNLDSGLSVRNRILVASCLFQLARLSQELTAESIDLWLKAMVGKVNGFSQIGLIDVCREFFQNEPLAFRSLWLGKSEPIYAALARYSAGDEPYRNILRLTLFAIAEEYYETGDQISVSENKLAAERQLTSDEELAVIYLKIDLRRTINMELGQEAFTRLSSTAIAPRTISVEVMQ